MRKTLSILLLGLALVSSSSVLAQSREAPGQNTTNPEADRHPGAGRRRLGVAGPSWPDGLFGLKRCDAHDRTIIRDAPHAPSVR